MAQTGFKDDAALNAAKALLKCFWWILKSTWKIGKWIWKKIQKRRNEKKAVTVEMSEKQHD
jgi:hypothetical protein